MASANQIILNSTTTIEFLAVDNRDAPPAANTLLTLSGANTASDTSGIQTVDISSFGDGFAVPKVKVALDGNYSISGVVTNTPAHDAFRSLADGADKEKEAYMLVTNGDGSTEAFYTLITDYQTTRDQRDVLRFTSTANVQSDVTRTAAP